MLLPLLFTNWRFVPSSPHAASLVTPVDGIGAGELVAVEAHPAMEPTISKPNVRVMVRGDSFNRFPQLDVGCM